MRVPSCETAFLVLLNWDASVFRTRLIQYFNYFDLMLLFDKLVSLEFYGLEL